MVVHDASLSIKSNIHHFCSIYKRCGSYKLNSGETALHKAVQQKHRNICYMLVAAGANLTMADAAGRTPMKVAFHVEDNDLASYLESTYNTLNISVLQYITLILKKINRHIHVLIQLYAINTHYFNHNLCLIGHFRPVRVHHSI